MKHTYNQNHTFKLLMNGQKVFKPELYTAIQKTTDYILYERNERYKVCEELDKMFGLNTAMEEL